LKVLIVKLSSIGDVIHTLPALFAMKEGYKKKDSDFEIDWIVEEAASVLLVGNPLIDNVIVVKRKGWSRSFKENWRVAKRLRARRYDMVIDFQGLFKSALWVLLSRGKRRIGFGRGRELSSIVLNDKLPPYDAEKHAVERYLDLALYAGGKVEGGIVFPIHITDEERVSAEGLVAEATGTDSIDSPVSAQSSAQSSKDKKKFFVIVPRARWSTKEWSDESFIELTRTVSERYSLHALIVGSDKDGPGLEQMARSIGPRATNLAGRTSLKELAAIFGMAEFAITVDTGPMHLAAAMSTTTIALFGPTAPWRTGPYGKEHLVLRIGTECSPCFKRECPEPKTEGRDDPKCMSEITPATVTEAIERLLKAKRGTFKQ